MLAAFSLAGGDVGSGGKTSPPWPLGGVAVAVVGSVLVLVCGSLARGHGGSICSKRSRLMSALALSRLVLSSKPSRTRI